MAASRLSPASVLRLTGVIDLVVALVCLATPLMRSRVGSLPANAMGALLLAGSVAMFLLARRAERMAASVAADASVAPGDAR